MPLSSGNFAARLRRRDRLGRMVGGRQPLDQHRVTDGSSGARRRAFLNAAIASSCRCSSCSASPCVSSSIATCGDCVVAVQARDLGAGGLRSPGSARAPRASARADRRRARRRDCRLQLRAIASAASRSPVALACASRYGDARRPAQLQRLAAARRARRRPVGVEQRGGAPGGDSVLRWFAPAPPPTCRRPVPAALRARTARRAARAHGRTRLLLELACEQRVDRLVSHARLLLRARQQQPAFGDTAAARRRCGAGSGTASAERSVE